MRLKEFTEALSKPASFAFGRMNPPTLGHQKLVNTIQSQPGDHFLFLTHIEANNSQFNTDSIIVRAENNQYIFNVEIATSKKERSIGLMHRKNLKQNQGMLFIYPSNQIIKMWMKNTLIPLDMIFIKENRKI